MISTEDTLWSRRSAGLLLILAAVLLSTVCAVSAAVLSVEALSAQVGEEKEIHQYGADSPHTDSELGPGGWAILPPGSLFDGVEGAFDGTPFDGMLDGMLDVWGKLTATPFGVLLASATKSSMRGARHLRPQPIALRKATVELHSSGPTGAPGGVQPGCFSWFDGCNRCSVTPEGD